MIPRLRTLVEALCSADCNGRATGSPGGRAARRIVTEAFAAAGFTVDEQGVPASGGVNLLATLGDAPRAILVAAHYDHLGRMGGDVYRGADDNAAAVAILVETARALAASGPRARRVVFAAFDGEEPPHFLTDGMGSERYAQVTPTDDLDLMVCMDLVGHALGPPAAPPRLRNALFALGAEKSEGTLGLLRGIDVPGVVVQPLGINLLPPLSDYHAFQERGVPFLFLTGGRWRHYHTPADTPDKLDYAKMAATVNWLVALVRAAADAPGPRRFLADGHDDASTLHTLHEAARDLRGVIPEAARAEAHLARLRAQVKGRLELGQFTETRMLLAQIEAWLS